MKLAASCLLFLGTGAFAFPGDTVDNPVPIPSLPFYGTGTTCDYNHDYDEMCPYGGYQGPDVVYAFSPAVDRIVNVSLCESHYDTKTYIYVNEVTWGAPYACNDDFCTGPNYPYPYVSYLQDVLLQAGNTYYFVIDAYGPECGEYVIRITESTSCVLACPPGADEEGEPKCRDGYVDHFNGGCSADPPVFQPLGDGTELVTICGFSGTMDSPPSRDEDWYEVSVAETGTLTFCCRADFPALTSLLDGNQGCVEDIAIDHVVTEACELACSSATVAAGTYWLRIFPLFGRYVPCSSRYVFTIEGSAGAVTVSPSERSALVADLHGSFPNPFAESTTIRYTLAASGAVSLRVVDVSGRLVRALVEDEQPSGDHQVSWDGRNDAGLRVAGGTYFVTLEGRATVQTRRIVFLGGE